MLRCRPYFFCSPGLIGRMLSPSFFVSLLTAYFYTTIEMVSLMEHTHVGPKIGWVHVGHKGEKFRDIDLLNEARRPLYDYIQHGGREKESPYVFTSQRSVHFTEDGIHHWFRTLKRQANHEEWKLIADLSFHDLRHDFAHRARDAGWTLEEIAYYLGHATMKGTRAIETRVRYTQVSRAHVKEKLKLMRG